MQIVVTLEIIFVSQLFERYVMLFHSVGWTVVNFVAEFTFTFMCPYFIEGDQLSKTAKTSP